MAAALTLAELRGLSRLYRANVDGAREQLEIIVAEHADELPPLLGFPAKNLLRLREHEDPVELLVGTIEGVPRVARELRRRAQSARASEVAINLGQSAKVLSDGTVELDANLVAELVGLVGSADVRFGERGGVTASRLRALFRECRRVDTCAITLAEHTLDIAYTTARSRGLMRFYLAVAHHLDCVIVPLPSAVNVAHGEDTPEHVMVTPMHAVPTTHVYKHPRQGHAFAAHLVDAFLAAAVGGLP